MKLIAAAELKPALIGNKMVPTQPTSTLDLRARVVAGYHYSEQAIVCLIATNQAKSASGSSTAESTQLKSRQVIWMFALGDSSQTKHLPNG